MRVLIKIFLITAYALLFAVTNGCTTKQVYSRTIDSEQIANYGQHQQGLMAYFRIGDTVEIFTKEEIQVSNMKLERVKLVVKDSNPQRIAGKIVEICCDPTQHSEQIVNQLVEVNLEDIDRIRIWKKQSSPSGLSWILIVLVVLAVGAQSCGTNLGECLLPL